MLRALPLSNEFREEYILCMDAVLDGKDPLAFIGRHVFSRYPAHWANVPRLQTPADLYRGVIRYCEVSAWSEEPPLIISLLQAFKDFSNQDALIQRIRNEGPFRCHPPGMPPYVARVSAIAPLLDRKMARLAALGFDPAPPPTRTRVHPRRVLMVKGDDRHPGLPTTLSFFRYLAAIQPEKTGVLYVDFGNQEMVTQAASENIPIELFITRDLEQQARHIREELNKREAVDAGDFYDDTPEQPFKFESFTGDLQRAQWTRNLALDFVERALYRVDCRPSWWVAVFDNCKMASPEAQEFVRRLVELAAGTGQEDVEKALRRQLRIVLVGDVGAMIPSPIYANHLAEEDVSQLSIGLNELKTYYTHLASSLGFALDPAQIAALSQKSLDTGQELLAASSSVQAWTECLVRAVLEQTAQLELQAAKKGGSA